MFSSRKVFVYYIYYTCLLSTCLPAVFVYRVYTGCFFSISVSPICYMHVHQLFIVHRLFLSRTSMPPVCYLACTATVFYRLCTGYFFPISIPPACSLHIYQLFIFYVPVVCLSPIKKKKSCLFLACMPPFLLEEVYILV